MQTRHRIRSASSQPSTLVLDKGLRRLATHRIELRHLRYFRAASELSNLGQAAKKLNISPPAVSRQIQELERLLETELFERLPRGVRLSKAGRVFLEDVKRILDQLDEAGQRLHRVGKGQLGTLRLALNESATSSGAMPKSIRDYRISNPDVRLELIPMISVDSIRHVLEGEIDAAFAYVFSERHRDLSYLPVESNAVILALHESNPLSRKRAIRLADLQDEAFVFVSRGPYSNYHDELLAHCSAGGLRPRIVQEVLREDSLLSLVSTGMAVGFVSSAVETKTPLSIVLRRVSDLSMPMSLELVWCTRNRSPALLEFTRLFRGAAGRPTPRPNLARPKQR